MTTPTLHQAAQVALDALEPLSAYGRVGTSDVDQAALQQVCAALREALAQPQAEPVPEPYLCIAPACGTDCSICNQALSLQEVRNYAIGYAILRNAPIDAIKSGGVFAGRTPDNVVINGADLDAATFGAAAQQSIDQQVESINAVFDAWRNGEDASMTLALSAPPADGDRVEAAIDDYIDGYVMEGDDGYYQPNDGDTAMLKDAMMGLLVDPGFLAAYDATPPAVPPRGDGGEPDGRPAGATPMTTNHQGETMKKRRYSGHDKHFGPFTLSKHNDQGWRPFGIMLDSDGNDDYGDSKGCNLKLHGFGHTLILELPQIIQPYREKHMAMSWDAATVARLGRDYYFEVFPREFGFTMSDKTLHVHYGPQTHDSTTTKNKVFFLPWLNWRFVRQSWYGPTGQHIETLWETSSREVKRAQWDWRYEFEKTLAKNRFEIEDYDGQRILVDTNIEEREWRFGTGAFAWLSLFRRPMIKRSLNIAFAVEVGPQKGSWKGGLMGTGIDMLPGELHEAAFRRYCEQEHRDKGGRYRIKFIGKVA